MSGGGSAGLTFGGEGGKGGTPHGLVTGGSAPSAGGHATSGGGPATTGGSSGAPAEGGEGATARGGSGGTGGSGGASSQGGARVLVATRHYDELRTGANQNETVLTTANVNSSTFGRIGTRTVRGGVFGQPLYVPDLVVPGVGERNVVFVTTLLNYVYAFDADDLARPPYWVRQLGVPVRGLTDAPSVEWGIVSEAGILGTPALSIEEQALYVVSYSKWEAALRHRLHKLSLGTGADFEPSPVDITGELDSRRSAQISALLVANGKVFVSFGVPLLDEGGRGSLFAYDAATLAPAGRLTAFESRWLGPVWMGGQGPAWDGDNLYIAADAPDGVSLPDAGSDEQKLGSRVFKLRTSDLAVEDWFLPRYVRAVGWTELGSTGPIPIPGTDQVVVAGNRAVYVLDRRDLGKESEDDSRITQKFTLRDHGPSCQKGAACDRIYAPPVYWDREGEPRLYIHADADVPRAYAFDRAAGKFSCGTAVAPVCESVAEADSAMNSFSPSLSLSSNRDEEGILWSLQGQPGLPPSDVLRAYDAETLRTLWTSPPTDIAARPQFAVPVVTGGQVFIPVMPGLADHVVLDGERPDSGPALAVHGRSGTLVVVWRSEMTNEGLKVAWSSDGRDFGKRRPLFIPSLLEPSLASDGASTLYLAWVDASSRIHVIASQSPDFEDPLSIGALDGLGGTQPLEEIANASPALTFGDGKLYLAWRNAAGQIVLASSAGTEGFDLANKSLLSLQASSQPPALAHAGGRLYLLATNSQSEVQVFESIDGGKTFHSSNTPMARTRKRAAVVDVSAPGGEADSYLFWFDAVIGSSLNVIVGESADLRSLSRASRLPYEGDEQSSVSTATFRGFPYVAWDVRQTLHVARYTPGEIATYGLITPTQRP